MNKSIIFITGAPAAGKSSISKLLSTRLNDGHIYIGTDHIRAIVRANLDPSFNPELFTKAILAGEGIDGFLKQAELMEDSIASLLNRIIREELSIIIEGIHLLPRKCMINLPSDYRFKHFVLNVPTIDQHERQMKAQGNDRSKGKLENIDRARLFQEYLIKNSANNNIHVLENIFEQQNSVIDKMMSLIQS